MFKHKNYLLTDGSVCCFWGKLVFNVFIHQLQLTYPNTEYIIRFILKWRKTNRIDQKKKFVELKFMYFLIKNKSNQTYPSFHHHHHFSFRYVFESSFVVAVFFSFFIFCCFSLLILFFLQFFRFWSSYPHPSLSLIPSMCVYVCTYFVFFAKKVFIAVLFYYVHYFERTSPQEEKRTSFSYKFIFRLTKNKINKKNIFSTLFQWDFLIF